MSGHYFKDGDGNLCWASNPGLASVSNDDAANCERVEKEQARVKRFNQLVSENGAFEVNGVRFEPTADGAVSMRSAGRSLASIIMDNGRPGSHMTDSDD